ncbi:hypothetical protein TPHA_0C04170 [Tetrapisispora phaffii CBS 4417]|uniref:Malic enzyme n=1 Tax=Tetrapisispora phaffii (strain ATCC 24235 / CBS 4417 / NBRC 1672 / NRRL Y-8282 / UCD 70-5) TaxID=1071381 RepID=G8BQQ5_TETPH|nr:hypothetical protein TPHA_0C04170 [Tetrapisispora phaffii CBS 4417]CCE62567.1 hypothetical protein TPHA_0C04170 [Tetrapisispora phaffii CBS 4417]
MLRSKATSILKRTDFSSILRTNKRFVSTIKDISFESRSQDDITLPEKQKSLFEQKFQNKKPSQDRLNVNGSIECSLHGFTLLDSPLFNKGTAFTKEERDQFGLSGLLPPKVSTLEEQLERNYKLLCELKTPLEKNDFMTHLRMQNKVLYFAMVKKYIRELVPIIYTPTEGDAIAKYSDRLKRPEGVFLNINEPEKVEENLAAYGDAKDVDYIVVTDSEGILGIGDQGVGGIRISVSKMALMTLCGGIHPGRVLPVCLDVGTNNQELLNNDLYTGNRFPRVRGEAYDKLVDAFITGVKKQFPNAILHFEDFGVKNARRLLEKYRNKVPCFNDDIQGTGAVVTASLIAALKHTNRDLKKSKILIYGAGSAGIGIADQIASHMVTHGLSLQEARSNIYLINRKGLILESNVATSSPAQHVYAKPDQDWEGVDTASLQNLIKHIQPTCLVGCSTKAGAFTKECIQEMHKHNSRPIVFPLSNPTRLHEAVPEDVMKWTNNEALVATGSPFKPVNGYRISENNNCFSFPGIGLGSMLAKASIISDKMISAAVDELASLSPLEENNSKPGLLPPLEVITETSARVATAVLLQALEEGTARVEENDTKIPRDFDECLEWVKESMWQPIYRPMTKVNYDPSIHTQQT